MTVDRNSPLAPWLQGLSRRDRTLSDAEQAALAGVVCDVTTVAADKDLVRQHDRPTRSTLLVEGWACRYIDLSDGRRQIIALHLPGEFVDLHSFPLHRMDHNVLTLTPCRVAYAPHDNLRRLTETHPHITRVLWLSTLIDGAISRQWLLGAGKRTALENLAHLLCELHTRLHILGLNDGSGFELPLTQVELGQALGISSIHANRVVQELRGTGLVNWRGNAVEIVDREGLDQLADFDPTYLHLEDEPR